MSNATDSLRADLLALTADWEASRGLYPPDATYDAAMRSCIAEVRALLERRES